MYNYDELYYRLKFWQNLKTSAIIAGIMLLIPLACQAQDIILPIDSTTKRVTYVDIVEVKNKKDVLFKNAQDWITKNYGNYKAVVQLEDKEAGKIIMKGASPLYNSATSNKLLYTIAIDCRENKYRSTISDLTTKASGSSFTFDLEALNVVLSANLRDYQAEQGKRKKEKLLERANQLKAEIAEIDKDARSMQLSLKQAMSKNDDF